MMPTRIPPHPRVVPYKQRGGIALMLFGAVFFGFGMLALSLGAIPPVLNYFSMKSWVAAEAVVLSTDLETHQGSDSTTYKVVAQYQYQYRGLDYVGDRVGLSTGSDNIGNWHRDTYNRLKANPSITIWVNPDNPEQSIIDRNIRWGTFLFSLLLAVLFGGIGLVILIFGWFSRKKVKDHENIDGPVWVKAPEWRDNQILTSTRHGMWFIWFFAIVWNLISSVTFFIIPREWSNQNYAVLLVLIFPLVGMGLLYWAIKVRQQWKRFGKTPLSLDPFPGETGNRVGGKVRINAPTSLSNVITVTLSCIRKKRVGSGKNAKTQKTILWQDVARVTPKTTANNESAIEFDFFPPAELPESSDILAQNGIEWEVQMEGETAKGSLDRQWVIPVTRGERTATGDDLELNTGRVQQQEYQADFFHSQDEEEIALPKDLVDIQTSVMETRFFYPMLRSKSLFIVLITGAVFMGIGFTPVLAEAPFLFRGVFALMGLVSFLAATYALGNSLTVLVDQKEIRTVRNVLGFRFSRQALKSEIVSLEYKISSQTTSGTKTRVNYKIFAQTADQRRITIAESLPHMSAVKQIYTLIIKAFGPGTKLDINKA